MVVLAVNKMARGDSVEVLVPSQLCLHYAQNCSRNVKICKNLKYETNEYVGLIKK